MIKIQSFTMIVLMLSVANAWGTLASGLLRAYSLLLV